MSLPTTVVAGKLAGRCANGLERGQGLKMHALPAQRPYSPDDQVPTAIWLLHKCGWGPVALSRDADRSW